MHDAIETRLAQLRAERERGEEMLADLQARAAALRETLLRISGAIQVLEELTGPGEAEHGASDPAAAA
jgi:ABC-type Fe3+-hydroxamate transport system substrate-binding protein